MWIDPARVDVHPKLEGPPIDGRGDAQEANGAHGGEPWMMLGVRAQKTTLT